MRSGGSKATRIRVAGALGGLMVFGVALAGIDDTAALVAVASAAFAGLAFAHRSAVSAFRASRGALLMVAAMAAFGCIDGDWLGGLAVFLRFATLVAAAQIITRLWSWNEICGAFELILMPLEKLRLVDAGRCAFTLMLAVRFVPLMCEEMDEIREAQALRGLDRSVLALAIPLGLRILLRAEEIAEAVELRGLDHAPPLGRGPASGWPMPASHSRT
jgi:biotin transport system permease protein